MTNPNPNCPYCEGTGRVSYRIRETANGAFVPEHVPIGEIWRWPCQFCDKIKVMNDEVAE